MNGTIGKVCVNKSCPEKGKKQPYTNFYKNPGYKDGYQGECKKCLSERSKNHKREKQKDYYDFFNTFM
jgi:hypothetical protein